MIKKSDFITFSEKIKTQSALVIGDVMVDRYLYGNVNRLSPEAPVPVLDYTSTKEKMGGAGNVALNFKSLGVDVDLISFIGNDLEGDIFLRLMDGLEMPTTYISQIKDRTTTLKTRVLAGQQHLLRVDREKIRPVSQDELGFLKQNIKEAFQKKDYDIVVLQDYNKGIFTKESIKEILSTLKEYDTFIGVDPKVNNFWEFKGVDIIKPNLLEISAIMGKKISPKEKQLKETARYVEAGLNNKMSVFTLAEHGIYLHRNGESLLRHTEVINIVDVCGAGDAVIASLTLSESVGMPLEFTAELCNIAGRIVCNYIGVVPVHIEQLEKEVYKIIK